ncbi:MAG: T9SS type A sorting domain-containing protein [Patescibacteria group bacterium]
MKKLIVFLFLLVPLFVSGQVKNEKNFGYPLMKLEAIAEELPAGNYLRQVERLAKTTVVPSVDYSHLVTVRDQLNGNTCVSFVTVGAMELSYNLKFGSKVSPLSSPGFIYNLVNLNNSGSAFGMTLNLLQDLGCPEENKFPYNPDAYKILPDFSIMEAGLSNRINSWDWWFVGDTLPRPSPGSVPISTPGYLGVNIMKEQLAAGKPVMIEFSTTVGFGGNLANDNWIYSYDAYGQAPFTGGHSLLAVGYDDNKPTRDGPGAIRFLNSWGNLMDNGFVWISYKALALQQFNSRAYVLELRDNYKPTLVLEMTVDGLNGAQFRNQDCGLVIDGATSSQKFLRFIGSYVNPTQILIDLTDLNSSMFNSASFFIRVRNPEGTSQNLIIKSLHFVDASRDIDYYFAANQQLNGGEVDVEWNFRSTDFSLSIQPSDSVMVKEKSQLLVKVGVDPGKPLSYSLTTIPVIEGLKIDTAGNISWVPDYNQAGVYKFVIKGTDTEGASSTTEATITVLHTNRSPVFSEVLTSQTVLVHNIGQQPFQFSYSAVDPDNDQVTFTLSEGPIGSSISTSGQFTWLPSPEQAGQAFPVVVYVTDGELVDSTSAILTGSTLVGVEDLAGIPTEYALSQNYPNPFNPATTIRFALPKSGRVTLVVYNLLGQEVSTLVNEELSLGSHEVKFDANNLASGIYIYRISTADFTASKKMLLTK